MKYLIIVKENNIIFYIANKVVDLSPIDYLIDDDFRMGKKEIDIVEKESIPDYVIPEKYCYTEKDGYYLNPNWEEPEENKEGEN